MKHKGLILLTATKTGGHLLPTVAVAQAIRRLEPGMDVHIVTSGAHIEQRILKNANLTVHVLRSGGLKGTGRIDRVVNLAQLPLVVMRAMRLIRQLKPMVVAGFGGFTTGPVLSAAFLMRVPTALLEANSIPGLTNKLAGRFVDRVFLSFEATKKYFPRAKIELTGTPVRNDISFIDKGLHPSPVRHILVFGGSQGARFLNEQMPQVFGLVRQQINGITVLHQTGEQDVDTTREAYRKAGVDASVSAYIDDMAGAYKWADFVVARAGAGTIAELCQTGLPSLLIPFPFAADNHQYYNALTLQQQGAALLVIQSEFDVRQVAGDLTSLFDSIDQLGAMASAARGICKRDAAGTIAERLLKMGGARQ